MKKMITGAALIAALVTLSGCQHDSSAVGNDGRPHAPAGQQAPGGTLGSSPVGAPQS